MREGWRGDDYLVLFAEDEIDAVSQRYAVGERLPGYAIVGLRGWDDLVVRGSDGRTWSVPTVPLIARLLEPFELPGEPQRLDHDERFAGRIKWYVHPIVFGGDPNLGANVAWVPHDVHAQLVRFWNARYDEVRR